MADTFEFSWTDAQGGGVTIAIGGIADNIARAIRSGLNREATKNGTISAVTAKKITETRADLGGVDP